jgi:hypothetical protein
VVPVPRQQLGQVVLGAGWGPAQRVGQPSSRIAPKSPGGDQEAVDHCSAPSGIRVPNEQPVFGEAGAGERGAILYTVIESCRRQV